MLIRIYDVGNIWSKQQNLPRDPNKVNSRENTYCSREEKMFKIIAI